MGEMGEMGEKGEKGDPGILPVGGAVYVRWGNTTCPPGSRNEDGENYAWLCLLRVHWRGV